jgi:hypothetical protein
MVEVLWTSTQNFGPERTQQELLGKTSVMTRMKAASGVPTIKIARGIEVVSSKSRTASSTNVANLPTSDQTRHAASTDVDSKCLGSASHTQPDLPPIGRRCDRGSPTMPTSSCPPRASLLNCIVPSQPAYEQGFRSSLTNDMEASLGEDAAPAPVVGLTSPLA